MWSLPVNFSEGWGRGGVVGNVVCANEQRGGGHMENKQNRRGRGRGRGEGGGGGSLQLAKLGKLLFEWSQILIRVTLLAS